MEAQHMAQDNPRTNDQPRSRSEASSTTAQRGNDAATRPDERERAIDTARERGNRSGGTGLTRSGGQGRIFGSGRFNDPFSVMQRMAEDMDQLFDQFGFGRMGLGLTPSFRGMTRNGGSAPNASAWSPQVEMKQRGDRLVIRADVPGVKKEDLRVEVENGVLTLCGERNEEKSEEREGFYRSERSYGEFYRAIPLPEGVDEENVEATYRDGVLEVSFRAPKRANPQSKQIPVR